MLKVVSIWETLVKGPYGYMVFLICDKTLTINLGGSFPFYSKGCVKKRSNLLKKIKIKIYLM
jgi:hypothetical protein